MKEKKFEQIDILDGEEREPFSLRDSIRRHSLKIVNGIQMNNNSIPKQQERPQKM